MLNKSCQMKINEIQKPELEDFNLTKELLKINQEQHNEADKKIRNCFKESTRNRNEKLKKIGLISGGISVLLFFLALSTSFSEITMVFLTICLFWDLMYGLYAFQKSGENAAVNSEIIDRIKQETIDENLEKSIKDYNIAIKKYWKATAINENSIVKAELVMPSINKEEKYFAVGEVVWIVFSNKYLANPQSYPDIYIPREQDENFLTYYNTLIEKQKKIKPKLKKSLGLEGEVLFFYTCSDMFLKAKEKHKGDIIILFVGGYRILEVINFI